MKNNTNLKNVEAVSLTERVRQIASAILITAVVLGGSAQATVARQSSVVDRAVAVQDALKKKIKVDGSLPRAQILLAQWGNAANWGNWNNWVNWDNWNNWHNWFNYGWGNF